jgi:hypothetical protein
MDPILDAFRIDLNRLRRLLELLETVKTFSGEENSNPAAEDNSFVKQAQRVLINSKECHPDLVILTGTMVLYLGGRFEYFVRTEFEFLCARVAGRCDNYRSLPREMQASIVTMTAKVIAEPRKYGHGNQGLKSFITNLANMLGDNAKIQDVTSACLSVTDANMRADVLNDLFQRIGAKSIWDRISQQAKVQRFFETAEEGEARNKARSFLNSFMDIRNRIAHPSVEIDWPDPSQVRNHIDFFEILAQAISEITDTYEIQLSRGAQQNIDSQRALSTQLPIPAQVGKT